jgi:hypothetical protein
MNKYIFAFSNKQNESVLLAVKLNNNVPGYVGGVTRGGITRMEDIAVIWHECRKA